MVVNSKNRLLKFILLAAVAYGVVTFVWASNLTGSDSESSTGAVNQTHALNTASGNSIASGKTISIHAADDGRLPCSDCHEPAVKSFKRTIHAVHGNAKDEAAQCGTCHAGNLAEHSNDTSSLVIQKVKKLSAMEFSQMCLSCHENTGEQSHANLSEHTVAGVNCISCHNMHPSEQHQQKMATAGQSAMFRGTSTELCLSCHKSTQAQFANQTKHRVLEGIMKCVDCHNPHGDVDGKSLRADNKQVCLQCHQDKRGPFLFEHGGLLGDGGCTTCHENHGGGNRHMLKMRDPKTLCMSCHSREGIGMHSVSGFQYADAAPVSGLTSAGDCTRCHAEIHGSNTTPFLHR